MKKRLCNVSVGEYFLWLGVEYILLERGRDIKIRTRDGYSFSYFGRHCQMIVMVTGREIRTKCVNKYTMNGRFIRSYKNLQEAAKACKTSAAYISSAARGERKSTGGFKYKYSEQAALVTIHGKS